MKQNAPQVTVSTTSARLIAAFVVLFVLMLSMTGCGGSSPTAVPATAMPLPTSAATAAPPIGETLAVSLAEMGKFTVSISGAVTLELNGDTTLVDSEGNGTLLAFTSADPANSGKSLTFVLPDDIQPGSYDVQPYFSVVGADNTVSGVGAVFTDLVEGTVVSYNVNGGSLTLTGIEPYSGSFDLSAAHESEAIAIGGAFRDLIRVTIE
jgi:predicted small lipoprotein YifL